MSADRDVTRIVRSWLEEGVTRSRTASSTPCSTSPRDPTAPPLVAGVEVRQMNTSQSSIAAAAVVLARRRSSASACCPRVGGSSSAPSPHRRRRHRLPSPLAVADGVTDPAAASPGVDRDRAPPIVSSRLAPYRDRRTLQAMHDLVACRVDSSRPHGWRSGALQAQSANFAPTLIIGRAHHVYADPCHPDPASTAASRHDVGR